MPKHKSFMNEGMARAVKWFREAECDKYDKKENDQKFFNHFQKSLSSQIAVQLGVEIRPSLAEDSGGSQSVEALLTRTLM